MGDRGMTQPIEFFVSGEPKGQPRARAFAINRGGKTMVRMYDPATAEGWKNQIAAVARPFIPPTPPLGPVMLRLHFNFPRPKAHLRSDGNVRPNAPHWHTSKPDIDNCTKAVMDALKTLGFFKDDAQVCEKQVTKVYFVQPGCIVTITYLPAMTVEARKAKEMELAL
jgi:Holliday junction resolvase RusA-like endonuclease